MITHEALLKEWEKDAKIDKTQLDDESVKVPKLHSKYLGYFMDAKTVKSRYLAKIEAIRKEKEMYYSGQATSDVYKDKPFDTKLRTKAGIERHVETDPEVVGIRQKVEYIDNILEGVSFILEQIKWRSQHIKNALDFMRFTSGSL